MTKKIGFIGTGNMGAAILNGLAARDDIERHGFDHHRDKLAQLAASCGLKAHDSAASLTKACDVVVVAVKPQYAEPVVKEIAADLDASKCLVSICAGLTVDRFKDWSENRCPVVRVMPDTPALVGESVSAVCLDDKSLSDELRTFIPGLFASIGQVHVLPERLFDAFTGVVGSGPAYVFYFMEALIESGVALGLTRPQSTEMVKGLFLGSAKMAAQSEHSVSQLREMVTSPGGTTVRALMHFDRQGTRGDIIDAVFACYQRSLELGK